jgi:transposase
MPKRLSIQAHLAVDELERRYRRAKDAVARSHRHIIWLLAQGLASAQVAVVTGYTVNWLRTLARRYHQLGAAGLEDRRHRNPGATGLLSAAQRAARAAALEQPPPDGGVWTGPKAAAWMAAKLGRRVHPQRGRETLRRLGWTSKVPRPRHVKADPTAQIAFKKPPGGCPGPPAGLPRRKDRAVDDRSAPHRAQAGRAPRVEFAGAMPPSGGPASLSVGYLYAFVHPSSGRTRWLLLPTVSVAAFTLALAEFAQAVGAGQDRHVLLVLDSAGWHTSPQVQPPVGVHLPFLPPYSPELQPAERLWPLTNEALANRYFQRVDELQAVREQRCLSLQMRPEVTHAYTHFHWWPQTA